MKSRILILLLVVPVLVALAGCASKNPEGQTTVVEPSSTPIIKQDAKSGNSASTPEAAVTE